MWLKSSLESFGGNSKFRSLNVSGNTSSLLASDSDKDDDDEEKESPQVFNILLNISFFRLVLFTQNKKKHFPAAHHPKLAFLVLLRTQLENLSKDNNVS